MQKINADITIIGAGLTGLTTAYYLTKAGFKVVLIEKQNRSGGVINTKIQNGFTYETGPNTGIIGTPEIVSLFEDLSEIVTVEMADSGVNSRWIWKKGKWNTLPSSLLSAISTPLFSIKDKFRILGEPFRKTGKNKDETVAEMVKRRLGRTYLDYAVDPFVSGIYAGDPEILITRHALPKLYNLEHKYGSFITGALKKRFEPKSEPEKNVSRKVFSIQGGLINLINALEKEIGSDNILLNCSNVRVENKDDGYHTFFNNSIGELTELFSGKVISTVGGNEIFNLLPFVSESDLKSISNVEYAKVIQVIACYRDWKGVEINAFGGLVPSRENRKSLGILFTSSIFNNRAPKDGAILSVFLGGVKNKQIYENTDNEIKSVALKEIEETLGSSSEPDLMEIFRYPFAIPQYYINTDDRLTAVERVQNMYPGLIIAGNLRDGIGMADRIKQGRNLADLISKSNVR